MKCRSQQQAHVGRRDPLDYQMKELVLIPHISWPCVSLSHQLLMAIGFSMQHMGTIWPADWLHLTRYKFGGKFFIVFNSLAITEHG